VIVGGNGVSGPTFVDNAAYRKWVWDTFQADALDMETAAVAHVAYVNRVPYIAFRSLSDLAGGGPGENKLPVFFQLAADRRLLCVAGWVQEAVQHSILEPGGRLSTKFPSWV
jgi:adenosylhomocysteine nucleosidase